MLMTIESKQNRVSHNDVKRATLKNATQVRSNVAVMLTNISDSGTSGTLFVVVYFFVYEKLEIIT